MSWFCTSKNWLWFYPESIDTGDAKRDEFLKSNDFFDVATFKETSLVGKPLKEVNKDGSYNLYCDLTMKAIKKQINLKVEFEGIMKDPWGNEKAVLNINGKINRKN